MKATEELKKGIMNYVDKVVKDINADVTYSAIIKSPNDEGYNILLNNIEYQNVPTIGGTCVFNEIVRVLIPLGNYSNMVILKGGESTLLRSISSNNYSDLAEYEQKTNTFYNEKNVYQRTIILNMPSEIEVDTPVKFVDTSSFNIDEIIKFSGTATVDGGNIIVCLPCFINANANIGLWYNKSEKFIYITASVQYAKAENKLSLIIEYTKI